MLFLLPKTGYFSLGFDLKIGCNVQVTLEAVLSYSGKQHGVELSAFFKGYFGGHPGSR